MFERKRTMQIAQYQKIVERFGSGSLEAHWASTVIGVEPKKDTSLPPLLQRIVNAAVNSGMFATIGDGLLVALTEEGMTHEVDWLIKKRFGAHAQTPKTMAVIRTAIAERVYS